jgi:hypothetical protein
MKRLFRIEEVKTFNVYCCRCDYVRTVQTTEWVGSPVHQTRPTVRALRKFGFIRHWMPRSRGSLIRGDEPMLLCFSCSHKEEVIDE